MAIERGQIFSYADDTAIVFIGDSWDDVHKCAEAGLTRIARWLNFNLLTLNTQKTNYICFSIYNSSQPDKDLSLKIHSCTDPKTTCSCPIIEKVYKTKYLGVIVDQRLSWHYHIDLISARIRKLMWIFKTLRYAAPKDLITRVYVTLAQSIIIYCAPVWGGASKTKLLELERSQRALLKVIHFKPYRFPTTELYEFSNVLTVRKLYILHTILKFHKSLNFDPSILNKRRNDIVARNISRNTAFASSQYSAQSAYLYNKINKILQIYTLLYTEVKIIVTVWLKSLNYEETELVLKTIT